MWGFREITLTRLYPSNQKTYPVVEVSSAKMLRWPHDIKFQLIIWRASTEHKRTNGYQSAQYWLTARSSHSCILNVCFILKLWKFFADCDLRESGHNPVPAPVLFACFQLQVRTGSLCAASNLPNHRISTKNTKYSHSPKMKTLFFKILKLFTIRWKELEFELAT